MNAEQMFKELGYANKNTVFSNIICYEKDASIRDVHHIIGIQFVLNDEHVSMYSVFGKEAKFGAFNYLDVKLLNAINKQCEELGWLDEKTEIKEERNPEVTNFEHYKDGIIELCLDDLAISKGKISNCNAISCSECDFEDKDGHCIGNREIMKWLKQPYKKPTYKLTKFEKELLECYSDVNSFELFNSLNGMKEKGYFKGIDTKIPIREILDNCEVI